ncbi:sodium:solute symporter family transporter [Halodurantibacterium flavum]|uniref:Sodium/solute symporter n=1 Tax=Halodurantibacterium flavum TaxID=1382802 RepID=A0ABW4S3L8_9RHOB
MPDFEVTTLDLVIVVIYILGILGLGIYIGRQQKDSGGFFLGGRGAIWPIIGLSLMSANLSGTSYVGLAGAGYDDGIAVWNYEWIATVVLVFFAVFILPFYLRSKVETMPEFLEKRYSRRTRYVFSGFSVVTAIFIDSAGALFAGALTLQLLFPEYSLWFLVVVIAVLAGGYVILGGLRAVMITDTVQAVLLLIVGTVIFFMLFREMGSWEAIRNAAPEGGFTLFKPADDDFLPAPGILTGVLWLGLYYWIANHVVVQKVLAARDTNHGRWGVLLAGALQLPFLFILIMPGMMGREFFPDLEDPDHIWPALVFDFLPVGIRGLALAALIAALMSTLDSVLNGSASMIINDFVKTRKKDMDEARLLWLSRAAVAGLMVIAALWAPMIGMFGNIVEYFQSFLGHLTMPVVVVFLGGLFWRGGTADAAFWTLAIGVPVGIIAFMLGQVLEVFQIQFLYAAGLMLLFSAALFVVVSLRTETGDTDLDELTWSRRFWDEESDELKEIPAWQNYRYIGIVLIAITAVMVAIFA